MQQGTLECETVATNTLQVGTQELHVHRCSSERKILYSIVHFVV